MLIGPPAEPGDRPGETLSASAKPMLDALGLSERVQQGPHRESLSTYAAWGTPALAQRHAMTQLQGPGYVLDRPAFDATLAQAVHGVGIDRIPQGVQAVARCAETEPWVLTLADGSELLADFLIDCTGRAGRFGRQCGSRVRADRLVAAYTFLSRTDPSVDPTPAILVEAAPGGWWYAALLPDERLTLAYFSDPDGLPRHLTGDPAAWRAMVAQTMFIRRWLDTATFDVVDAPRLTSAGTTWLAPAAGPGWVAAGDAACAFDPLSSHGLATALWTGRHAALAAIAARDGQEEPLRAYATTVADAVMRFLDQRANIYGAERRWPDAPFWRRRQASKTV